MAEVGLDWLHCWIVGISSMQRTGKGACAQKMNAHAQLLLHFLQLHVPVACSSSILFSLTWKDDGSPGRQLDLETHLADVSIGCSRVLMCSWMLQSSNPNVGNISFKIKLSTRRTFILFNMSIEAIETPKSHYFTALCYIAIDLSVFVAKSLLTSPSNKKDLPLFTSSPTTQNQNGMICYL